MCHIRVINQGKVKKAKNDYPCQACEFIREALPDVKTGWLRIKFTFAEMRLIVKAKQANWRILKGEPYDWQYNTMDGDTYTFKARPGLAEICSKYDLYPEC